MRKGYLFYDVLIGIFLIGLIAVTTFPILGTAIGNFKRIKENTKMNSVGEYVVERLNSPDPVNLNIFSRLETSQDIQANELLGDENDKYNCLISKVRDSGSLWELNIIISSKYEEGGRFVTYRASIPKK